MQATTPDILTVPLLDMRLHALRSDFKVDIRKATARLERRMYTSMFALSVALLGALYFFTTHLVK